MYTDSIPLGQVAEEQKLKNRILSFVRTKLFTGELAPGSRLSEVSLAKEVGISRTPVREAMMQLHAEGVVDQLPRYGWFVRSPGRSELIELYELRELLEGHAAASAATIASESQIAKLRECLETFRMAVRQMRKDDRLVLERDQLELTTAGDLSFHEAILRVCGNSWVLKIAGQCRLIGRLHAAKWRLSPVVGSAEGRSEAERNSTIQEVRRAAYRTLHQHHQIFRAIRSRKANLARQLMSEHIRSGLANALSSFDGNSANSRIPTALAAAL